MRDQAESGPTLYYLVGDGDIQDASWTAKKPKNAKLIHTSKWCGCRQLCLHGPASDCPTTRGR